MKTVLTMIVASLAMAGCAFKASQFGGCFFTGQGDCAYRSGEAPAKAAPTPTPAASK